MSVYICYKNQTYARKIIYNMDCVDDWIVREKKIIYVVRL